MVKSKWDGVDRRSNGDGRRVCPMHDGVVRDSRDSVQWKVFVLIVGASIAIVGGGFGWFGNDLLKIKDTQLLIVKTTAEQTEKNTNALSLLQREVMQNVSENQRETRAQVEKIASQLEVVAKIQQVVLNEIGYLKRYDELDRLNKDRIKR